MSSQKGNIKKQGPPKHQNAHAFKNTMHDTSNKTKMITSLEISGVCSRCSDVIQWKIKYKKYKPLTQAKKCVKCQQKKIKRAYFIVCKECSNDQGLCGKCGQKAEIVQKPSLSPAEEARKQSELEFELSQLPERKRRTFYRYQDSQKKKSQSTNEKGVEEEGEGSEASESEDMVTSDDLTAQDDVTTHTADNRDSASDSSQHKT